MTTELTKQTIYDAGFRQGLAGSRQPIWLKSIRKQAFKFFTENGFPTPRNEEWKYTNVAPIGKEDFDFAPGKVTAEAVKNFTYAESVQNTLVFIDGKFNSELSTVDASFTAVTLN